MVSATDELRELLDEHNIKWWSDSYFNTDRTEWVTEDGPAFMALDMGGRDLAVQIVRVLTPRRAIEATVGNHAKRIIVANGATGHCRCSACSGLIGVWDKYCKHCGAKLEPEDPHLMSGGADL